MVKSSTNLEQPRPTDSRYWHSVSGIFESMNAYKIYWAASSEFGTYRLCEQRRFRRACASAQSRQNLRSSLIQAVSPEEPSNRKPDPWPLSMAGHAQLKFVMTECSKTQIRLTRPYIYIYIKPIFTRVCCHLWQIKFHCEWSCFNDTTLNLSKI